MKLNLFLLIFCFFNALIVSGQATIHKASTETCNCIEQTLPHINFKVDSFQYLKSCTDEAILNNRLLFLQKEKLDIDYYKTYNNIYKEIQKKMDSTCMAIKTIRAHNNLQKDSLLIRTKRVKTNNDTVTVVEEPNLGLIIAKYFGLHFNGYLISYKQIKDNYFLLIIKNEKGETKSFLHWQSYFNSSDLNKLIKTKVIFIITYRQTLSHITNKIENEPSSIEYEYPKKRNKK